MSFNLSSCAVWLDSRCRYADLRWQRMDANILSWLGVKRQNFEAFLWPGLLAAVLWTGMPTFKPAQSWGVAVGLAFFALSVSANGRCKSVAQDLLVQVALLWTLGIGVWVNGPNKAGMGSMVYQHLLIPIVLLIAAILLLSLVMARELCQPLEAVTRYPNYLGNTELFQLRGERLPRASGFVSWMIFVPFSVLLHALQWAWPVAIAVLVARPASVHLVAWLAGGGMALILMLAAIDDRLDSSILFVDAPIFSQRRTRCHDDPVCSSGSPVV